MSAVQSEDAPEISDTIEPVSPVEHTTPILPTGTIIESSSSNVTLWIVVAITALITSGGVIIVMLRKKKRAGAQQHAL